MNLIDTQVDRVINNFDDLKKISNCSVLVTGGTGFIGSYIIRTLSKLNKKYKSNIEIFGMVRNQKKVQSLGFDNDVKWLYATLDKSLQFEQKFDYIIHTASPTDSSYFVDKPVEVINDTINGMNNIMTLAIKSNVKSMVFLSSLEVYGICNEDKVLAETDFYSIDPTNIRNSYSEGKKILECLCCSYASEYKVPVKIIRLGQCFGPGISRNDRRVFSQFANAIVDRKDIVLSSKGETKRSYCSICDSIIGIFSVLLNGINGEAYNLASDNSYISIYELAELFIKGSSSNIIIEEKTENKYLPTIKFCLDTYKIKAVGFRSIDNVTYMVKSLLDYFKELK